MNNIRNMMLLLAALTLMMGCGGKADPKASAEMPQTAEKTAVSDEDMQGARLTTMGKVVSARYADLAFAMRSLVLSVFC